ncbi:hypothetical protein [Kineosporia sp. R_H_3]|uniref:hypothetical protein n=1 Tax=Kineosporia sp. R_H_3 TaxID=1961848 RepID=UPI000B4B3D9B|nr:hypothetical protein [Kineosporia sp. R_H_3]
MTSTTGTAHPSETSGTPDPYADAPTTMLPAMRVPSQGPVAPRIRQAPPGTTTLPAAGFSWAPVAGLGYEAKLDDAGWRPCDGEWYAIFIDLPAGPHHFYVRSVDRTSGARSDAARYDWVVG